MSPRAGAPRPGRRPGRPAAGRTAKPPGKSAAKPTKRTADPGRGASASAPPTGPFRLGAIPGATPGKWIDIWQDRMPRTPLELVPIEVADQRHALVDGVVDAALVRLPLEQDGLHVIPLYEEVPVVVCAADSHLLAADELTTADLAGEVLIVPEDDVLDIAVAGTEAPRFAAPASTGDAIATVAAGVGVVVVPMSLARLHHRKDADFRPLVGGPTSRVALAWPAGDPSASVDAFIGIVRGRTVNSSRG